MTPEIKAKWLEALRSGRYQQADSNLRTMKGHCCLGVLCDVVKDYPSIQGRWIPHEMNYIFCCDNGASDSGWLPDSVCTTANVDRNITIPVTPAISTDERLPDEFKHRTHYISLATLNDYGFTFSEIADLIEKYL